MHAYTPKRILNFLYGRKVGSQWLSRPVCTKTTLHACRNLTCLRRFCPLCSQNPNRRCQSDNNFALKHVESEPLAAACGATISICLTEAQPAEALEPATFGQLGLNHVVLEVWHCAQTLSCTSRLDFATTTKNKLLVPNCTCVNGRCQSNFCAYEVKEMRKHVAELLWD